ncbi:MAG: hypothetical protein WCH65_09365, partial [bacterium]
MKTKKKIIILLILLISSAYSFGQITIGTGTSTQTYPLDYYYGYTRCAMIYTATEIGTTGTITSIAFYCTTALNTGPTVIYMKAVGSTSTETAATWATKTSGATTVYSGTPAVGSVGWRTITLSTPFILNSGQNLEVLVECNYGTTGTGTSTGNAVRYSSVTNACQNIRADNSAPTGSCTVSNNRPNIQITIACSGTPTAGTAGTTPQTVCSGSTASMSVTGYSTTSGITLQWQQSADGTNWTNVSTGTGGTTASYTTAGLTSTTYYRCAVTCTNSSITSVTNTVTVNIASAPTLPWTENFDGVTIPAFPSCWYKENGDWLTTNNSNSTDDANARSGTQFLEEAYSATNEYIWTPGFMLTAGTSYTFSFWWAGDGSSGWTGDVFYNTSQISTGATQMGSSFVIAGTTTTTTYANTTRSFIPSSAPPSSFLNISFSSPSISFNSFSSPASTITYIDPEFFMNSISFVHLSSFNSSRFFAPAFLFRTYIIGFIVKRERPLTISISFSAVFGVMPEYIICPPSLPEPGPISMVKLDFESISGECSTMMTVLPCRLRCTTKSLMRLMSLGC